MSATGDLADVDEAVDVHRQAVAGIPAAYPNRGELESNLSIALWMRFDRSGNLADLDEAVDIGRQAVASTPATTRTGLAFCRTCRPRWGRGSSAPGMPLTWTRRCWPGSRP